jgi:Holliday junction resolvase RusA-like endonuclease
MPKYTIPLLPPSINKFAGRQNVWEYRELKKEWLEIVNIYCRPRPPEPLEKCVVRFTYFFKTKARHDVDNYIKFLLDGLVNAKIIKDDSFDCIKLELEGDYDKNNPRVEILVYEQ